jgi:hypothetical protein
MIDGIDVRDAKINKPPRIICKPPHQVCSGCKHFQNTVDGPRCDKFKTGLFYAILKCGYEMKGYEEKT